MPLSFSMLDPARYTKENATDVRLKDTSTKVHDAAWLQGSPLPLVVGGKTTWAGVNGTETGALVFGFSGNSNGEKYHPHAVLVREHLGDDNDFSFVLCRYFKMDDSEEAGEEAAVSRSETPAIKAMSPPSYLSKESLAQVVGRAKSVFLELYAQKFGPQGADLLEKEPKVTNRRRNTRPRPLSKKELAAMEKRRLQEMDKENLISEVISVQKQLDSERAKVESRDSKLVAEREKLAGVKKQLKEEKEAHKESNKRHREVLAETKKEAGKRKKANNKGPCKKRACLDVKAERDRLLKSSAGAPSPQPAVTPAAPAGPSAAATMETIEKFQAIMKDGICDALKAQPRPA